MTKEKVILYVHQISRNPFKVTKMLLASAVLIILTYILPVVYRERQRQARFVATQQSIAAIQRAVEQYVKANDKLPDTFDQLLEDDNGYIEYPWRPKDAWGTPFLCTKIDENRFEIRSAGPDKFMNTDDDLVGLSGNNQERIRNKQVGIPTKM